MMTLKSIIGVIATVLVFIGYVPYIRDIISGKTKPHIFSWFLWGFVTSIAFALQIYGQAGIGAHVTLAAALMCFVVIFLGFKYKSTVILPRLTFSLLLLPSLHLESGFLQ